MSRVLSLACLASGASATLSETVRRWTEGDRADEWRAPKIPGLPSPDEWEPPHAPSPSDIRGSLLPKRIAKFGDVDARPSEQALGTMILKLSTNGTYTAVEWNTANITVPADLIREVCGDIDKEATRSGTAPSFMYGIHEKWEHRSDRSAQGTSDCSTKFTGRRWDPSAACSEYSNNPACDYCNTFKGYQCSSETFDAAPDAKGSFAYRFLNNDACELGDLSGMHGELTAGTQEEDADCRDSTSECGPWAEQSQCDENPQWMLHNCKMSCGICQDPENKKYISLDSLYNDTAGFAQMSVPFGPVKKRNVHPDLPGLIGINCDASSPISHATNCGCIKERDHDRDEDEEQAASVGTLTVTGEFPFYLADDLRELDGKSVVVSCGSAFGEKAGKPLFCAKLK